MSSAEDLLLSHMATIAQVASRAARRYNLSPDDAQEFASSVILRLIEDDYAIIRAFQGRSSFATYLTVVINRLVMDERIKRWGKWRPSTEATRLGIAAVRLEQLMYRDGLTTKEAVAILSNQLGTDHSVNELEDLCRRLPERQRKPLKVGLLESDQYVAAETAEDGVLLYEGRKSAKRVTDAVNRFMETLDCEDRLLLRMRFAGAFQLSEIAAILHDEPRRVRSRIEKLLRACREHVFRQGIDQEDIDATMGLAPDGFEESVFLVDAANTKPERFDYFAETSETTIVTSTGRFPKLRSVE